MELLKFLEASPTAYQAVQNIRKQLSAEGAAELFEDEKWDIDERKTYYVVRNASSLIAFTAPKNASSFRIYAAHADSPAFKIKENAE
ncbi:MAG: M18 family aminopeptidase, partial [Lachnospiraceae bacterium]|nr:M18 family aminopeptidase [Lachnospiraceae bacterium]